HVDPLQISQTRYQRVCESQAYPLIVDGFPSENQGHHRQRRALPQLSSSKRARGTLVQSGAGKLRVNNSDRTDETVPLAYDGFQEAGLFRVVSQGRADFSDDVVEIALTVDKQIGTPKLPGDFFARDHLLAPADQEDE